MTSSAPASPTLEIDRVIRASRDRVWRTWTDAALVDQWSCPVGMHIPQLSVDFRVGGEWEVVMALDSNPSERHVAFGTYLEITPPERIVQEHQWRRPDGSASPRTVVTVEFREEGAHTRLTLTQVGFDSTSSRDSHREGWTSTLDRLAALAESRP